MTRGAYPAVVRQIESLFDGGSVVGLTDRQLLERFTNSDDATREVAFAALVRRHGPLVLSLCHQLVGDRQLAEDAFQAIFLILARKARSIRDPELLGNWLYGVTRRTARKARVRLVRVRKREDGEPMTRQALDSGSMPVETMAAREHAEALHDEIGRLPSAFRLPVVLCYFEGLTVEEAAGQLKWPHGTVRSRLARARDKLRRGLTRRGVVLPAGPLVTGLMPRGASASIASALCDNLARAALEFAAGRAVDAVGGQAMALAREVLRSMLTHKMRFLAMTILSFGAVVVGAGYWHDSHARQDNPAKPPAGQEAAIDTNSDSMNEKPSPGRMFVFGRVLDPQGKPVPNAKVMVHARVKHIEHYGGLDALAPAVIGADDADRSGQFRLSAPRTSSSRNDEFVALALAPGYGVGWAEADPDADRPRTDITLTPEQVIEGRLFDLQGRPAQGVIVSVSSVQRVLLPDSETSDRFRRRSEGPSYWWARVNDWPAWPKPATTGTDGRFSIHGVSRGLLATLTIIDSRFALKRIKVETDNVPGAKSVTMSLRSPQIISGHVIYAETGKPAAEARLDVSARGGTERGTRTTYFLTDSDGRFRVSPSAGDQFSVHAWPHADWPYIGASKQFTWPKGAIEHSVDLALTRGVLVRGKITEHGSNLPVANASVTFLSHRGADESPIWGGQTKTLSDGSFEVTAPLRAGHLAVQSPNPDYIIHEVGGGEFLEGHRGGIRTYSHAFHLVDPRPGAARPDVNVTLRKGVTVSGRIIGPDNQPIAHSWIISRIALSPSASTGMWEGRYHGNARDGHFEFHGLDPDASVPVYFLEPGRKLGATVLLPGQPAKGEPMTVRLQPCGTAQARLVDSKGQPVAGYRDQALLSMIVTPGALRGSRDPADKERLVADADYLPRIDSVNYQRDPTSDSQGRVVFPALIPGANYRVTARSPRTNSRSAHQEFTVKPGETLELGDIQIERPRDE